MSQFSMSVNGKRVLLLLVNQVDLAGWQQELNKKGICLVVERSERLDLFEYLNYDRIMIVPDDINMLNNVMSTGVRNSQKDRNTLAIFGE